MASERTILIAFTVEASEDRPDYEFEKVLTDHLALAQRFRPFGQQPLSATPQVTSWWVAEDNRQDGSDNDSAVFVTTGLQKRAYDLLIEADMTGPWNRPKE